MSHRKEDLNKIDSTYIRSYMINNGIKSKDICNDTGLDKTNISAWINGKRPMSKIVIAMFHFYFINFNNKQNDRLR